MIIENCRESKSCQAFRTSFRLESTMKGHRARIWDVFAVQLEQPENGVAESTGGHVIVSAGYVSEEVLA